MHVANKFIQCTSENKSSSATKVSISKLDYEDTDLHNQETTSVDEVKQALSDSLDSQVGDIGYISPGHGMRGMLLDDDDVNEMYALCNG